MISGTRYMRQTALTLPKDERECKRKECGFFKPSVSGKPRLDKSKKHYADCEANLSRTARRSAPDEERSGAQRSPTASTRRGKVRIVRSRGSRPSSTSFQVKGAEAPANSLARA